MSNEMTITTRFLGVTAMMALSSLLRVEGTELPEGGFC